MASCSTLPAGDLGAYSDRGWWCVTVCHRRVIMKQPDLCCECSRLEILAALCPKRTLKGRWRRGPFNVRYRSAARVRAPPSPRLFDRRSTTIVRLLSVRLAGHGTRQQPRSRGLLREARTRHRAPRSLHLSRSHSSPIPLLRRDDEIASAFIGMPRRRSATCHAALSSPAPHRVVVGWSQVPH